MLSRPSSSLRILTWHVHGSYLYYLAQIHHEIYVPVDEQRSAGYAGRTASYPWPDNVIEVPRDKVKDLKFDCVLYQSRQQYLSDQHLILSEEQRRLPALYLEHDPPREHPTDTKHPVQDANVMLVHVTAFNQLMWDAGPTPTRVIEHGVMIPSGVAYRGDLQKGVTVINNLRSRGRRLGLDLWTEACQSVPLDLYGMGWEEVGGQGEVSHQDLPGVLARYRFFFNPIRYTSFGLSVCEAMATGLPIIGMATTEMVTVIRNGESGFLDTRLSAVISFMKDLISDRRLAESLGEKARQIARERFSIRRSIRDWDVLLAEVTGTAKPANKTLQPSPLLSA